MQKFAVTLRQEMEIVLEVEAESEDKAIELINEGKGTESNFFLVDEFISEINVIA